MHEIGVESQLMAAVLSGVKTIEGRLGTPRFLKIRVGDKLNFREDIWQDGTIVRSIPNRATATVKQLLYFEAFEEMLASIDFQAAVPTAGSASEALATYREYYTAADEYEYGVVAITFALDNP